MFLSDVLSFYNRQFARFFCLLLSIFVLTSCGGGGGGNISKQIIDNSVNITSTSLPDGEIGANYLNNLSASGGSGSYVWNVSGDLPNGLLISPAGEISGIPTEAGTFNFEVNVSDASNSGNADSESLTIIIAAQSNNNTQPVAIAQSIVVNQNFSVEIILSGTDAENDMLTYAVSSQPTSGSLLGTIPNLTYTPNINFSGSDSFIFTVNDGTETSSGATVNINVVAVGSPISITTSNLANGVVSETYNSSISASGGSGNYNWSITQGSLPNGITLNSASGSLAGTPTTEGDFSFTVRVQDSADTSLTNNKTFQMSISAATQSVTITTNSLSNGVVDDAYQANLAASGGSGNYNWSITQGSLPNGITLNSASGSLAGTPTTEGDFSFTVRVQDSADTSLTNNKAFEIRISIARGQYGFGLNRVGTKPVIGFPGSDGPARYTGYYGVVAYDDGLVAPLDIYSGATLMKYHPENGNLTHVAYNSPHEGTKGGIFSQSEQYNGNEDDERYRMFAHKGANAESSFFMWTASGWTELDPSNGEFDRDGAVFLKQPLETTPGSKALVESFTVATNHDPVDAHGEPGQTSSLSALAYDQQNQLLFVPLEKANQTNSGEFMQIYELNVAQKKLINRKSVMRNGMVFSETPSFAAIDSSYGVGVTGYSNYWETQSNRLTFWQYTPSGDSSLATLSNTHQQGNLVLTGKSGDQYRLQNPQGGVFADDGNHLFLIIAGNTSRRDLAVPSKHAYGLYVFDLGALGSVYKLERPIARIPFSHGITDIKIYENRIIASSQGLHVYDLNAVISANGDTSLDALVKYPLPYETYQFDIATIESRDTLFLGSGEQGIDIFDISTPESVAMTNTMSEPHKTMSLPIGQGISVLETGVSTGLRHLGEPVLNNNGDVALWATTDSRNEVILHKTAGERAVVVINSADSGYTSFGRPSINDSGNISFFAGKPNGAQDILFWNGSAVQVVQSTANTYTSFRHTDIDNNNKVLFMAREKASSLSVLLLKSVGSNATEVVKEQGFYVGGTSFAGGVLFNRSSDDHYDITPNGQVLYLLNGNIYRWNNGSTEQVGGGVGRIDFVRAGTSNSQFVSRTFSAEVTGFTIFEQGQAPNRFMDRHSRYNDGFNPANFRYGAINNSGQVAVATSRHIESDSYTISEGAQGMGLIYYNPAAPSIRQYVAVPGTSIDGGVMRNIKFTDGFNDDATISFSVAVEKNNIFHQKLLIYPASAVDALP